MINVKASCNIRNSSYPVSAISKSLRMRQGVHQISAQQQNNDSKQNHTIQLLFSLIPGNRPAAGTSSPAATQGRIPPAGLRPSSNPSYPRPLKLIKIMPYPMRRFSNLDYQRKHSYADAGHSHAKQQNLCHKLVLLSQSTGTQNTQPLFCVHSIPQAVISGD